MQTPPLIASLPGTLAIRWSSHMLEWIEGPVRDEKVLAIDAGAVLVVPLSETDLDRRSDYLDIVELWSSAERPGRYHIVNCACGIAYCGGVDGGILVTHPDTATVVWDIDVREMHGMFPRPPPWGEQPGVVRLIFGRDAYERSIRDILRAMQARAVRPLRWEEIEHLDMGGVSALESSRASCPTCEVLPIIDWLPDWGSGNLETLLAMDPDAPFVLGPRLS
jgi:hypothetical protein